MSFYDVQCEVCGEMGSATRMDLNAAKKCYYCRAEDEWGARPNKPDKAVLKRAEKAVSVAISELMKVKDVSHLGRCPHCGFTPGCF